MNKAVSRRVVDFPAPLGDKKQQIYRPPGWAWKLLWSFLDPEVKPTVTARCKTAGLDRSVYYRAVRKADFVAWFHQQLFSQIAMESFDVRQALYKKAVFELNLQAIKLWFELFGDSIPTYRSVVDAESR